MHEFVMTRPPDRDLCAAGARRVGRCADGQAALCAGAMLALCELAPAVLVLRVPAACALAVCARARFACLLRVPLLCVSVLCAFVLGMCLCSSHLDRAHFARQRHRHHGVCRRHVRARGARAHACCACECCAPSCWACGALVQRSSRSCGLCNVADIAGVHRPVLCTGPVHVRACASHARVACTCCACPCCTCLRCARLRSPCSRCVHLLCVPALCVPALCAFVLGAWCGVLVQYSPQTRLRV